MFALQSLWHRINYLPTKGEKQMATKFQLKETISRLSIKNSKLLVEINETRFIFSKNINSVENTVLEQQKEINNLNKILKGARNV
jgi:hypothetical protein